MSLFTGKTFQFQSTDNKYCTFLFRPTPSFSSYFAKGTGFENEDLGAAHADDVLVLFNSSALGFPTKPEFLEVDSKVGDQMIEFWTNFAKFHDPSGPNSPGLWKPFENTGHPNNAFYMEIGENSTLKRGFHPQRMKFWEDLYWSNQ